MSFAQRVGLLLMLGGFLGMGGLACPAQSPGAACKTHDDCLLNEVCVVDICRQTCNVSADCPAIGLQCYNGYCIPQSAPLDAGQIDATHDDARIDDARTDCSISADCPSGLQCHGGHCIVPPMDAGPNDAPHDDAHIDDAFVADANVLLVDECALGTDNCDDSHGSCTNTPGSFTCACDSGWKLNADGHTCDDVDECALGTDNCDHRHGSCTNTPGSFTCACDSGWELNADGHTCDDVQCISLSDGSSCRVYTEPDRDFDVCVDEHCVSPGCGDASCNLTQSFALADTGLRACYDDREELSSCPGVAGDGECAATPYCGQDAQYGDGGRDRFTRDLTVSNEPTVSDAITGLMWQGCSAGLSGENCATGSASTYPWRKALAYCEDAEWAGYKDWRLPGSLELHSIVDYSTYEPAIDSDAFPATRSNFFWSSCTYDKDVSSAWDVHFYDGHDDRPNKTFNSDVRCVRLGS